MQLRNFKCFIFTIDNTTDSMIDDEFSHSEKKLVKNGFVNGKINSNGNGVLANGLKTHQNGNIKSDVAVIDIIDDGKFYLMYSYKIRWSKVFQSKETTNLTKFKFISYIRS